MRTGNEGWESVSLNCRHMTPSVWPCKLRTEYRPRRQLRSMRRRSLYTAFHGRLRSFGDECGIGGRSVSEGETSSLGEAEIRAVECGADASALCALESLWSPKPEQGGLDETQGGSERGRFGGRSTSAELSSSSRLFGGDGDGEGIHKGRLLSIRGSPHPHL